MTKEEIEALYHKTFSTVSGYFDDLDITFDTITQKDRFIIAAKKEEEHEVQRMNGTYTQNSMIYCIIDTSPEAKYPCYQMSFFAEKDPKNPTSSVKVCLNAGLKNAENKKVKYKPLVHFYINNCYIDTADKTQLATILAQGYNGIYSFGEQYDKDLQERLKQISSLPPRFYTKLLGSFEGGLAQHHRITELKQKEIQKYKKNQLKIIKKFYLQFIGDKSDFKIEKEHQNWMERIKKFCKRIAERQNKKISMQRDIKRTR